MPFKSGELKAVGSRDGHTVQSRLITAGAPARIELVPDKTKLAANGEDVSQIEVRLVDEHGVLVPNGNVLCGVRVNGSGRLLSLDNGDQRDMTPLQQAFAQIKSRTRIFGRSKFAPGRHRHCDRFRRRLAGNGIEIENYRGCNSGE